MKSHFIDLNVILSYESKAWIVDKNDPNIPIMKIEPHEFNLFKSGVYMSQGNKISFNGKVFWLPSDVMNILKIKSKNNKCDISNLGISLQEFMNKDIIDNVNFDLDLSIFDKIINTNDDVYVICSKNTKRNFEKPISKIEEKLLESGIKIKDFYYVSETFYNREDDDVSYRKVKILLEHLIGLKIDGDTITDTEIDGYDQITYWDDSPTSLSLVKDINNVLESLLLKSSDIVKSRVRLEIRDGNNSLVIRECLHNRANKYQESIVDLIYSNTIRSFESFRSK